MKTPSALQHRRVYSGLSCFQRDCIEQDFDLYSWLQSHIITRPDVFTQMRNTTKSYRGVTHCIQPHGSNQTLKSLRNQMNLLKVRF